MFSRRANQQQPAQTMQSISINAQQRQAATAPYLYKLPAATAPIAAPALPQYVRPNLTSTERHTYFLGDHSGSMSDIQSSIYTAVAALQAKAR